MLFCILRRSHQLHALGIGCKSVPKQVHQSHTLHTRCINLYSHRLCYANGFGVQSLTIAGTNTIAQHVHSNTNSSIHPPYNHLHRRYVAYGQYKKASEPHKHNWNKKFAHGIEYDTKQQLTQVFQDSIIVESDPHKTNKKRFDFEYMEFLKQKYRNTPSKRRRNTQRRNTIQSTQKHEFCASASSEPGAPAAPRLAAARVTAQQQQIMAKEDEINPTSLGGMMVIFMGMAIFYWLYNIDNTKHSGISSFLSRFSRTKSIEEFIEKQERKPIHKIPDDWTAFKVMVDHIKNSILCLFDGTKYNSEWIWSKLFRLFYIPSNKLLPPTKQNVYTLVIDLDTVCHSTWSRNEGFERTMRPYYKEFINRMFLSGWEVVIFGQCEDYDWLESPDFVKLDGKGYIQNYLWNKDCYYFNGHRCKDLSRLGRDLKHVIAIDSDARSLQLQPENALVLNKWKPTLNPEESTQPNDNALLQLIEFLEYLAKAEVADVRQVLAAYRGKDIAQEFRKRYFAAVHAQLQDQAQYEEKEGEEPYDEYQH